MPEARGVEIKISVRKVNDATTVIELDGEIDVYTSPKVKDAVG
ncbi:MAG: hypothetical protein ACYDA1_07810 [Vulcanimicrobiaceae bacterium]